MHEPRSEHQPEPRGALPIFAAFLAFGARAFGGPVVQIEALLQDFVRRRGWIDEGRFRRALGVCQVLPGPEAHEMCCYLGTVRGGRLGGFAAGLGFLLPGLVLMLAASALSMRLDLRSGPVAGAMLAMQLAACALMLRAGWKLARPLWGSWRLAAAIGGCALTLALLGPAASTAASNGAGEPAARGALELFGHGLVAGLVTFGGAYSALPYIASVATGEHGWMTQQACLDGVAIASVLPAPLVLFGTFVGYRGGGLAGALAFTAGIFLPAFAFTVLGFGMIERLVAWKPARATLDALGALAVGLIAGSAISFSVQTLSASSNAPWARGGGVAPALFLVVVVVSLRWLPTRFAAPIAVLGSAAIGALVGSVADAPPA